MAKIDWTDSAPVDGSTTLTAARWEQLKTDIGAVLGVDGGAAGAVTAANMADGAISRVKMASGNQDVVQAITIPVAEKVLTIGSTTYLGASSSSSSSNVVSLGFTAKTSGTIVSVDYAAKVIDTTSCSMALRVAGSIVAATAVTLTTGSDKYGELDALSVSVSDGQVVDLNLVSTAGTASNVGNGHAVVYFKRTLA